MCPPSSDCPLTLLLDRNQVCSISVMATLTNGLSYRRFCPASRRKAGTEGHVFSLTIVVETGPESAGAVPTSFGVFFKSSPIKITSCSVLWIHKLHLRGRCPSTADRALIRSLKPPVIAIVECSVISPQDSVWRWIIDNSCSARIIRGPRLPLLSVYQNLNAGKEPVRTLRQ